MTGPGARTEYERGDSEIPEEEWRALLLAAADAREAAQEGRSAVGYAVLMREMSRAEQALVDGMPWAIELLARWRVVVDEYSRADESPKDEE